ncbi:MAG: SocA family protein [Rhizobiales bacterium]|nr:SocA family protein [Hyphomicrobiales bacterium]
MAYDPRAIANLVLKYANNIGVRVTNLAVNKIVYFLHGHYLAKTGKPLVDEQFEAWQHGPVLYTLFNSFKRYGDQPIDSLAKKMDFQTEVLADVDDVIEGRDLKVIWQYINIYTRASVSQLYDWSHVKGGPWYKTWNYQTTSNPGMIISDHEIANHFRKEGTLHGGFRA